MTLRFGILLSMAYDLEDPHREVLRRVEQIKVAQEANIDAVWLGHHMLTTPLQYFQPVALAARLAESSGDMSIGVSVLAPFVHPIQLAEDICSLDMITGGHIMVGLTQGWRKSEREAFQLDSSEAFKRFLDTWDLLPRLWTEPDVNFTGRSYALKDVTLGSRPLQSPHPPLWIGASKVDSVRRVGRRNSVWLASAQLPLDAIVEQANAYEEEIAKSGGATPSARPILRNLVVSKSKDLAQQRALASMETYYGAFKSWGLWESLIPDREFTSAEDLIGQHLIFGSPEECSNQISSTLDRAKRDFILFKVEWPGMSRGEVRDTIRMLGEEIIPKVRENLKT